MGKKVNYIFLFLGIFSLFLSAFDFHLELDIYGALLAVAWGLFFIFLAYKDILATAINQSIIKTLQAVLIIFILLSGILKLYNKF